MVEKAVRDLMKPRPWTIDASLSIQDAAHLMRVRDVSEVLVTDDGELRGRLASHDIIVLAIAAGRHPSTILAGESCRLDIPTVAADVSREQALHHMRAHGVGNLPVVDDHRLVGTVWMADLAVAGDRYSRV